MKQSIKLLSLVLLLLCSTVQTKADGYTHTVTLDETLDYAPNGDNGPKYKVRINKVHTLWVYYGITITDETYYTADAKLVSLPDDTQVTIEPFTVKATNFSGIVQPSGVEKGTKINATNLKRLDIKSTEAFVLNSDSIWAPAMEELHAISLHLTNGYYQSLKKIYVDRAEFNEGVLTQCADLKDVYVCQPGGAGMHYTHHVEGTNTYVIDTNPFGSRIEQITLHVTTYDYYDYFYVMGWRYYPLKALWNKFAGVVQLVDDDYSENVTVTLRSQNAIVSLQDEANTTVNPADTYEQTKETTAELTPYSSIPFTVKKENGYWQTEHVYLNGKDIIDQMTDDGTYLTYNLISLTNDTYIQVASKAVKRDLTVSMQGGGTVEYKRRYTTDGVLGTESAKGTLVTGSKTLNGFLTDGSEALELIMTPAGDGSVLCIVDEHGGTQVAEGPDEDGKYRLVIYNHGVYDGSNSVATTAWWTNLHIVFGQESARDRHDVNRDGYVDVSDLDELINTLKDN